jgi:hypothetical protein
LVELILANESLKLSQRIHQEPTPNLCFFSPTEPDKLIQSIHCNASPHVDNLLFILIRGLERPVKDAGEGSIKDCHV